jgi:hypothetical protein
MGRDLEIELGSIRLAIAGDVDGRLIAMIAAIHLVLESHQTPPIAVIECEIALARRNQTALEFAHLKKIS